MRVLHLISSMGGGGAERQLAYLANAQQEQGTEVHAALLLGGPNLKRLEDSGATVHWLDASHAYTPRLLFQLRRLFNEIQPDIVQAWNTPFNIYCGILRLIGGPPWIFAERSKGPWNPEMIGMLPFGYLPAALRVIFARTAAAVVTNSPAAETQWGRFWGRRKTRRVIGNALPIDEIDAAAPRKLTECDLTRPVIVGAGRLHPEKNWDIFIQALRSVLEETDATIFILGDGEEREHLRDMIAAYGLSDEIFLTGYVNDLWRWLKTADLMVSISRYEGNPNVVLEAMACGCPLLLSAIPGHREAVPSEAAAFIKEYEDPEMVASAILKVLAEPDAAARRAAVANENCRNRSPAHMAARYDELYNELLAKD